MPAWRAQTAREPFADTVARERGFTKGGLATVASARFARVAWTDARGVAKPMQLIPRIPPAIAACDCSGATRCLLQDP